MTALVGVVPALDELAAKLEAVRFDDTTALDCGRIAAARDHVREAARLVRLVLAGPSKDGGK